MLEANGVASRVTGDPAAILALQTNAVHFYQRPDAGHLGVDPNATSLSGHGGMVRFGRSDTSRLRLTDHFHWYSPGLDLNDVGFLRQADLIANQVFLGWSETRRPKGAFRSYSVQLAREDQWDFGGLKTLTQTELETSGQFKNKWRAEASVSYQDVVDTRMLRGGPALRYHDYYEPQLFIGSDDSRRASAHAHGSYSWARDDDSRAWSSGVGLNVRPSNRLSFSGSVSYEKLLDNLQYVATADADGAPRWVLGRIDQDTWNFTFRVNLSITPDLTFRAREPLRLHRALHGLQEGDRHWPRPARSRFHLFSPDEIAFRAEDRSYEVIGAGVGPSYSFAIPDFSFRQFRSNLVVRWE